jgi:plasmid stability protein
MASITIRQLDESIKARLRIRAAHRRHSMEEEAREILKSALTTKELGEPHLVESIRRRVKAVGGVELVLPNREPLREPPR